MKTKYLIEELQHLPELCTSIDLEKSGVFLHAAQAYYYATQTKKRKLPHFRFSTTYRYLKSDVIDWVQIKFNPNEEYEPYTDFCKTNSYKEMAKDNYKSTQNKRDLFNHIPKEENFIESKCCESCKKVLSEAYYFQACYEVMKELFIKMSKKNGINSDP